VDEAILRILLQDSGGTGSGSQSTPGQPSQQAPPPPSPQQQTQPPPGGGQPYTPLMGRFSPRMNPANFDPVQQAKDRRQREEMLQQIDEAYQQLYPTPEEQFDPVVEAQRKLDTERRRAAVEAEYAKLNPPPPPPTAHELALKRLQAEKDRQEIEAEYLKLNPPPPPPTAKELALKRLEAEKKRQEVQAEYDKLNPPTAKSGLDSILEVADVFRGTIGGLSPVIGSLLDMTRALQKNAANTAAVAKSAAAGGVADGVVGAGGAAAGGVADGVVGAGGAAAVAASAILPVAIVVAAAIIVVKQVMQSLDIAAERYGEYNPQIAQQQALGEVRQTLGDLRRSNEIGPELARYVKSQSELNQKVEDLKVIVLNDLLPYIIQITEATKGSLGFAAKHKDLLEFLAEYTTPILFISKNLLKILELFQKQDDDKDNDPGDPTDILFRDPADGGVKIPGI
jgi:hypothetical protein